LPCAAIPSHIRVRETIDGKSSTEGVSVSG
jgi:hypothetical protein